MKIKITKDIATRDSVKPKLGKVYDVVRQIPEIYYININDEEVGVFENECEVVE